jgi:NAD(P)H-quinone oxidoreductase subunit 5
VAIAQVDLKRACSYSTTSYLGLVFIAIALQQPAIAILFLFAHGLAKALLFMSVGSIIATTNCQDITELGGMASRMPATTLAFLVGSAGLVGVLPLGCFWCYGLIVESIKSTSPLMAIVFILTNFLTALNLTRLFRSVFLGSPMPKTRRTPEVNWLMALPMVSLSFFVVLLPWVMARLDPIPGINSFSLPVAVTVLSSGLIGIISGALVHLDRFWSRSRMQAVRVVQDLLALDFYTPDIYRSTIVAFVASLSRLTNWFDQVVVNGFVNGIGRFSLISAEGLRQGVSGQTQSYVLTVLVAIVLLFGAMQWWFN